MILFFALFLFNPLLGIVATSCVCWKKGPVDQKALFGLAIMMALFLGLQNMGKEMAGDIVEYRDYFLSVPNFDSIRAFMLSFGKEPLYYGYTYLAYYVMGGSWKLFILSITFINYMLLAYAIVKTGVCWRASMRDVVITLFFMLFFFQEFASIGHMIRQCLAQSITVVFFVSWYMEQKRRWWLILITLMVHTSALPVLGMGLIPMLQKKLTLPRTIRLGVVVTVLVAAFYYVLPMFSGIPFLSYVEKRANQDNLLGTDAWQTENIGLDIVMYVLLVLVSLMILYVYRKIGKETAVGLQTPAQARTIPYLNITIVLILALLVWNAMQAYYLLMRYYFFLYAFQNVIVLLFLYYWRPKAKYILTTAGVALLFVYFCAYYANGFFSYYPLSHMLLYPVPLYFIN